MISLWPTNNQFTPAISQGLHSGQCMLFQGERQDAVLSLLKEKNIQWSKLYRRNVLADTYELYDENSD